MLIVFIAVAIFVFAYRLITAPRSLLNILSGWTALLFCAVGIPAAIFGAITFLDGMHLPAIFIFVALCILWLVLVPA